MEKRAPPSSTSDGETTMTDNQDSKIGDAAQPPTDRPLTAGDIWTEWHGVGLPPLEPKQEVEIWQRSGSKRDTAWDGWSVRKLWTWSPTDQWPGDIIAYRLARPATSAASEVEPMRLVPDRVLADALYWMARGYERVHSMPRVSDTELANKIEGAKTALGRARDAAALASPPVSERERELEGALREMRAWAVEMVRKHADPNGTDYEQGAQDMGHRWVASIDKHLEALTAQPAGEGK